MKIRVTFKTPDVVEYAVIRHLEETGFALFDRRDIEYLDKKEELIYSLRKWFKYGETVTVEVDTDTDSAQVIEVPQ